MAYPKAISVVALGIFLAACSQQREAAFPYPRMVVDVQEQAHYKTALWCAYTGRLDSSVFRPKPLHDSLRTVLQKLISYPRTLKSVDKGSLETMFRFNWDFRGPAAERLFNNCYKYAPASFHFSPVMAVWVNNKDGLIDSVLSGDNLTRSPGPRMSRVNGKWQVTGPPDRDGFSFNTDPPCKEAFLRANRKLLSGDLLRLCQERNVFD